MRGGVEVPEGEVLRDVSELDSQREDCVVPCPTCDCLSVRHLVCAVVVV